MMRQEYRLSPQITQKSCQRSVARLTMLGWHPLQTFGKVEDFGTEIGMKIPERVRTIRN